MKKRFAVMLAVLLCVILLSGAFSPAQVSANTAIAAEDTVSAQGVRFLNILNRNYVYNDAFLSFDELTRGAVIANLKLREGDYLAETYVKGYLTDMYGINAVSFSQEAPEEKPGYLYITPFGYTEFAHSDPTVTANEDGTFTVITDVTVSPHDAPAYDTVAISLFAPNARSAFGYILVYSNLEPATVEL